MPQMRQPDAAAPQRQGPGVLRVRGLPPVRFYDLGRTGAPAAVSYTHLEGIPAAEEAIRVWNLASELLDQMALLLGEETLPAAECGELFELLARTTDLGHIPQSLDAVILTTAGRMRLDNPEFCFVLGLAEGEFPKAPGESGLLTHTERDSLIRQGVDMPDCFENRMVREQVCFYKALTLSLIHI